MQHNLALTALFALTAVVLGSVAPASAGVPVSDCNSNGIEDLVDIVGGTSADCNLNLVPDECDIAAGTSADCTENGIPDECDIAGGTSADCNSNEVPDDCDIAGGTSADCNDDAVPDECQLAGNDCNSNGIPDECEEDCNSNGVPDECDIVGGTSADCNSNGVPDECDIAAGTSADCNGDAVPDECQLAGNDCNSNGIPDECEEDCNSNGVPDDCDIAGGTSPDCNEDFVPDECQLAGNDCNGNEVPDDCETDCDGSGLPDDCDIAGGTAADCNSNGVPDVCDAATVQLAKLRAFDAADQDRFGNAVAIAGSVAIVGAPQDDDNGSDSGSAVVFVATGEAWAEHAKLTASDGSAGAWFGVVVAMDGDTAVVGANLDDHAGTASGSAYVYANSNGVWTEMAKLIADDAEPLHRFGTSVAISGDVIAVGANLDDDAAQNAGAVYVFANSNGTWELQDKLTASDAAEDDWFGASVAVSGDTLVAGSSFDDDAGTSSGSAYVFINSNGTWHERAKLTASDAEEADRFGTSVSIDGETILVGSLLDDVTGFNSGSAYVFVTSNGQWVEETRLIPSDSAAGDWFGASVAIDGDTAVIGATLADDGQPDSGSAYVFTRLSGVWVEQTELRAADSVTDARLGVSVAVDGLTAIVGANLDGAGGFTPGSAYVFGLPAASDCNGNGVLDACEIAAGSARDCDSNLVPDECDSSAACPNADVNRDDVADGFDIAVIRQGTNWLRPTSEAGNPCADVNDDGIIDGFDIAVVRNGACWLQ